MKKLLFFTKGDHGTTRFYTDKTYDFDNHRGYKTTGKAKIENGVAYLSDDQLDMGEEPSFAPINGDTADRLVKEFGHV